MLKRIDLPAADIAAQLAITPNPKPAFGRTILNPSSQYGPTTADLSGPTTPPVAVQIGDMNGGGKPDIIVSASDYYETGATANPASPCAQAGAGAQCLQAGRSYVYYGETIAGSDPSVIEKHPARCGQRNTARLALQQLYPDLQFEIANLPTQRRLRGVQPPFSGVAETAFLSHRNEITQMAKLHPNHPYL